MGTTFLAGTKLDFLIGFLLATPMLFVAIIGLLAVLIELLDEVSIIGADLGTEAVFIEDEGLTAASFEDESVCSSFDTTTGEIGTTLGIGAHARGGFTSAAATVAELIIAPVLIEGEEAPFVFLATIVAAVAGRLLGNADAVEVEDEPVLACLLFVDNMLTCHHDQEQRK